ncbi:phospholipase effector Tle1 domain-containing protein [Bradyrhizobium yuanmingense]|uniref:phospholipase effector Tle1 domain-containing protein n=1 Tax=Bradyrhizobium yuanmingense TaxID=108015 RepID=UPI003CC624B2
METAANSDHKPAGKNLVICCDGTGNEISENISNVLKLYRCLRKTDKPSPRQMAPSTPAAVTAAPPVNTPRAR